MDTGKALKRRTALLEAWTGLADGFGFARAMALHRRLRRRIKEGPGEGEVELPAGEKDMNKIGDGFCGIPFSPEGYYFLGLAKTFGPDLLPMYMDILCSTEGRVCPYPPDFERMDGISLLMISAEDDPICPLLEIDHLRGAAEGNPNVDIWILPTGNYCAFDAFDRRWCWSVMRDFLEYWAERPAGSVRGWKVEQETGVKG